MPILLRRKNILSSDDAWLARHGKPRLFHYFSREILVEIRAGVDTTTGDIPFILYGLIFIIRAAYQEILPFRILQQYFYPDLQFHALIICTSRVALEAMSLVSIILPATDETYSLTETVSRIKKLLPQRDFQFLVVTSTKLTTQYCRDAISLLVAKYPGEIESFDQNRLGLGGAIQDSIDRSTGEVTVLMASDLETDPDVLPALLAKIDEGYDIAATTRWKGGVRFKGYNPLKLIFNFFFQLFFRVLYMTSLSDMTYAYRAYKTPVLRSVRWEETKFPFLFESIVKPLRLGYRATEVPAPWKARTEGVSHNSFKQMADYFRVGLRARFLPKSRILY